MGSSIADPPKADAVPVARRHGASLRAAAVLSPVAAAGAVLLMHRLLPGKRDVPFALMSVPAWKHPFVVVLAAALVASLALALLHVRWRAARPWVRHVAPLLAGLVVVMGVWDLVTVKLDRLDQTFFPSPDEVFGAMFKDRALLAESAWQSLLLLACGYAAGVVAGVATGVLVGWFARVRYWVMPAMKLIGPVPATALIPVVMTVWAESFPGSVALIGFAVWFPVTLLTSSGIANVRVSYLDVARTLGASQAYLVFRVAVPAALPNIFIGMFVGLTVSFLTLVVAEAVGVQAGLGWYINWRMGAMEYAAMYGAIVVSAVFFSAVMTLLFKLRDRVLRWQKGVIKW